MCRGLKPELQLSRAAKLNLEDNIRQRKAHSKRDMAKFAKEVGTSKRVLCGLLLRPPTPSSPLLPLAHPSSSLLLRP